MSQHTQMVEFAGGPLDGYSEPAPPASTLMLDLLAIPINPQLISLLGGNGVQGRSPTTSIALYRLNDENCYQFVGAAPVGKNLDDDAGA